MNFTENIRDAILNWAYENGVLQSNSKPNNANNDLVPFPDEYIEFFRTRKIVRISIETNNKNISIYTRLIVAKTKIAKLQEAFSEKYKRDNISLLVDVSKT